MAKVKAGATAPTSLHMQLRAPGMTAIHRAGLGGLACTLAYIEKSVKRGTLRVEDAPGGPWKTPPWSIDPTAVKLTFTTAESAGPFLRRLFELAFQLQGDGLIYLPGQYAHQPSRAVLADLQAGLTLTFLQHGKVRSLAKEATQVSYDPEGEGGSAIIVEYRQCASYKHQLGWEDLVDSKGRLNLQPIRIEGPLNPGAVVRHVAFTNDTSSAEPVDRVLPLYFALVGCLALRINRGSAALIVPEFDDLVEFVRTRPLMTPRTSLECQIPSAADGTLQMQVRLRAHREIRDNRLPGCIGLTFQPTPWAKQQKSRVHTVHVPAGDDALLDRFERALAQLPPKLVTRTETETAGRGKSKQTKTRTVAYRVDSVVRPFIAENLANGRPWFAEFSRLISSKDARGKPLAARIRFERKGLNTMTKSSNFWDHEGQETVVRAVHEALRNRYGRIADENKSNAVTRKNRWGSEYDKWRLAFAGSRTIDQFRNALCDLFSRAGPNSVLRDSWPQLLPLLDSHNWQLARDLAMLALASYAGKGDADAAPLELIVDEI